MSLSEEMRKLAYRLPTAPNSNAHKGDVIKAWAEKVAELEAENQRLRAALQQIADSEAGISWQLCLSYIAKQALEKET